VSKSEIEAAIVEKRGKLRERLRRGFALAAREVAVDGRVDRDDIRAESLEDLWRRERAHAVAAVDGDPKPRERFVRRCVFGVRSPVTETLADVVLDGIEIPIEHGEAFGFAPLVPASESASSARDAVVDFRPRRRRTRHRRRRV